MVVVKELGLTSDWELNNRSSCSLFPVTLLVSLRQRTAFSQIHRPNLTNKWVLSRDYKVFEFISNR
jgi:hypothetical protein